MRRGRFAAALLLCVLLAAGGICPAAHAAVIRPVRIAFLDSGISAKHLDAAQIAPGENLIFPGRDTEDRVGHGTATASLVLGSAELGLAGSCPLAVAVPLVCYDRYPSGAVARGDGAVLAQGIRRAVDVYGCKIINISMGTTEPSRELEQAVAYAQEQGALLVAAVGNDGVTAPDRIYYPAAYEGVIAVGAADGNAAAAFSQQGYVTVIAQGVGLRAATNRNAAETASCSGTSYACALVSGLCARLWQEDPELTAAGVRERLIALAADVGASGADASSGFGLVDTSSPYNDARLLKGAGRPERGYAPALFA